MTVDYAASWSFIATLPLPDVFYGFLPRSEKPDDQLPHASGKSYNH